LLFYRSKYNHMLKCISYLFVLILTGFNTFAQSNYILQNETKLAAAKKQYQAGDADAVQSVNALIADADKALKAGPYSVTLHKTRIAPTGNPHDYVSQAPYCGPIHRNPTESPTSVKTASATLRYPCCTMTRN